MESLEQPCADCGQTVVVRLAPGQRRLVGTVLCADCLEARVWHVRETRPPPKQGSGQHRSPKWRGRRPR